MTIEVEGPDGAVIEFPDDTKPDVIKSVMGKHYAPPSTALDVGESAVRGVNKGLADLAMLPLRASAWLTGTQGKGLQGLGEQALSPYLNQPEPKTEAGRYAQSAGEVAGGSVLPTVGLLGKAEKLAKLAPTTALRATGQSLGETFANTPGRAVATDIVGSAGAGAGQEFAKERFDAGPVGQAVGGLAGAIAPVAGLQALGGTAKALQPAISPTLARWKADLDALRSKYGIHASADGGPPASPGATAAAEQVLANQAVRSGRNADDIMAAQTRAAEDARFHSSGQAQNVSALADDPAFQRLASSVARASPEAGNNGKAFITGRQTGTTPEGGELAPVGVPTRPVNARPIKAEEAERLYGTDFGAGKGNIVPMGQGERIGDAFKRALVIKDSDYHGHAGNAGRTDEAIVEAARAEAQKLYKTTYDAGQNVNISEPIKRVLREWIDGDRLANEAEPVQKLIKSIARLYAPGGQPIHNVERFDKTKRYIDEKIGNYFKATSSSQNRHVGGLMNEMKKDLLGAVDSIPTNALGSKYAAARGDFESRMSARRALEMGRDAWKQDSDIGVDAYRSLTSEGERKLFRLGMLDGYEKAAKGMKRGADKTQMFDRPNIQELMTEVIPRSKSGSAEFADRPERFGRYVGNERRMIETRDEVLGNSKTAQRLADDQAFQDNVTVSSTLQRLRESASVTAVAMKIAERAFNKLFGMRADTSRELARMLFNANPEQQVRILANVRERMGRDRFAQFADFMRQTEAALMPSAATGTAGAAIGGEVSP